MQSAVGAEREREGEGWGREGKKEHLYSFSEDSAPARAWVWSRAGDFAGGVLMSLTDCVSAPWLWLPGCVI